MYTRNKQIKSNKIFRPLYISNKNETNQMYSDLVIPSHDIENYVASMDQNESMEANWSYIGMNSMAKASMAWLMKMDDVLTEDFDVVMHTFGLIACCFHPSLSSLLLYLLQFKHAHLFVLIDPLGNCWKYALEAIINWLLLYFLVHDNRLLSMLELYW